MFSHLKIALKISQYNFYVNVFKLIFKMLIFMKWVMLLAGGLLQNVYQLRIKLKIMFVFLCQCNQINFCDVTFEVP